MLLRLCLFKEDLLISFQLLTRAAKREEAERQRIEMVAKREKEREEREAAFKESEKKRRREEYYR